MEVKKIIATGLITGLLAMNYAPLSAVAIEEIKDAQISTDKKLTKKQKKALIEKQNKIEYINIAWWEGYSDPYLNDYIYNFI